MSNDCLSKLFEVGIGVKGLQVEILPPVQERMYLGHAKEQCMYFLLLTGIQYISFPLCSALYRDSYCSDLYTLRVSSSSSQ